MRVNRSKFEIEKKVLEAEKERDQILSQAKVDAQEAVRDLRKELDKEHQTAIKQLRKKEKEVESRFDMVDRKREKQDRREEELSREQQKVEKNKELFAEKNRETDSLVEKEKKELSRVSGLNPEEAKEALIQKMISDIDSESKAIIARKVELVKEEADRESKEILIDSMRRLAHDVTTEDSTSNVDLPREEMKGKIIGKEGRNIRAFEKSAGVDVVIDESPEYIVVSSFDSYRREIARRAMEKLIKDGRIHPARIEEVVLDMEEELEEETRKFGEQTLLEAGFSDIHQDIVKVFGRLKFRQSYGQNQIKHSLQVMELCEYIAQELDLDIKLAKRCGLLHDIGKAIDQGGTGTHPALGYDLAKKCGENAIVCNAIAAHHEGVKVESIYTTITAVADAISASRPGARRESSEKYFERMDKLEEIACSFKGVSKAFAMRAGRELRIAVDAGVISDTDGVLITRDIAKTLEKELTYPGEVKVTLIRETRFIEYAR